MQKHIVGHTGKVIYKTQEKAEKIALRQTVRWNKQCRPYLCPLGGHWHITTMSKGRFYSNQNHDTRGKTDY